MSVGLTLLLGCAAGLVTWAVWLWESEYYWDEVSQSFQAPTARLRSSAAP